MLSTHIDRYLSLRRKLGFKLRSIGGNLRAFAKFAEEKGDTHIRAATALEWASQGISPGARHIRMRNIVIAARFLHAEDPDHEVPTNPFRASKHRMLPYIYSQEEIVQLMEATTLLRNSYPLRKQVYETLIGLIASTGLRISEALNLRISDVLPNGVLHIRRTKFGKSRMVPMHVTTVEALNRYLEARIQLSVLDDHVFLSASNARIASSTVEYTFQRMRMLAGLAPSRARPPRIHDIRHTFATRVLESCQTNRNAVARQFVALATYMGHSDIKHTFWYLQATPELMTDIASTVESFVIKEKA